MAAVMDAAASGQGLALENVRGGGGVPLPGVPDPFAPRWTLLGHEFRWDDFFEFGEYLGGCCVAVQQATFDELRLDGVEAFPCPQ